jgi:putative hemolysin
MIIANILMIGSLIGINGVLAMSEMAIASARRARLQERAEDGSQGARTALALIDEPNRFLSTIQIGVTLVGILAGTFGGSTLAEPLASALDGFPLLSPYSEAIAFTLVVIVITYFTLVIGELVPKRVALSNPTGIAARVARPMVVLSSVAAPIVRLLSLSTEGMLRLLGVREGSRTEVSEEEIKIMLEQGVSGGVFEEAEHKIVDRVFLLDDLVISSVMTPYTELVLVNLDAPPAENQRKMIESSHSTFPVIRGRIDQVLGVVSIRDLWSRMLDGEPFDLEACLQPGLYAPENVSALQALDLLKEGGRDHALVINEHGGLEGIVTLVDMLEAIVGDIPLAGTLREPEAKQRMDGSWLVDGLLPVEVFKEELGLKALSDEDLMGYNTVGGLVMMQLGRIPDEADTFTWKGMRFEVIDMDGYRVDKVLVEIGDPQEG